MEYPEDEYLMISGIQHFAFCRRQWALIHIEQVWQENLRTAEGRILHEKCHDECQKEKRGGLLISRGLRVFSRTMGVSGVCDVVEFHEAEGGQSSISIRDSGSRILLSTNTVKGSLWMLTDSSFVRRLCASKRCIVQMCLKVHCSMLHRIGGKR